MISQTLTHSNMILWPELKAIVFWWLCIAATATLPTAKNSQRNEIMWIGMVFH